MDTERNPIDLAAQDAAQQATVERNAAAREQFVVDFKWLMAHKQGRRIMWWLLSQCQPYVNAWRPDSGERDFRLGIQNVGQMLIAECHTIALDSFNTMMKEHSNDDSKRTRQ